MCLRAISSLFRLVTDTSAGPCHPSVELFTYVCRGSNATKSLSANQDSCLTTRGLLKLQIVPESQWRAVVEHCVCINALCDCSVLINVSSTARETLSNTQIITSWKKMILKIQNKGIHGHSLKENKALLHNKQVRQLHTCLGRENKRLEALKTHIQNICTHTLKRYLGVLPKKGEKLNINK